MTYELHVLRVRPGGDWQDTIDELNARVDEPDWPPQELDEADLRDWERIVRRVEAEIHPARQELSSDRATLRLDLPKVRLDYYAEHARVAIPHGYSGGSALRALERGYALARIAAEESGGVAVDPRIGKLIPTGVEARHG